MIPKKIHYCWFGRGQMPELAVNCINSWKKYLPDYELVLWNEENFDINCNQYVKEAYESKKYAFVTDYVRLHSLYYYGGIYMDTDMEVLKSLDEFLNNKFFIGCERDNLIQTGLIGAVPKHELLDRLLSVYQTRKFISDDGSFDLLPNPEIFTPIMVEDYDWIPENKFQILRKGIVVYPVNYFCAKDWKTGKVFVDQNTYSIHHYSGSWKSRDEKIKGQIKKILGNRVTNFVVSIKNKLK